jgi:hypothetical protein
MNHPMDDPDVRKRYNQTWLIYDLEHPQAYWLRGNMQELVCTRCGARLLAVECPDPDAAAHAWTKLHLRCRYAHGLRGGDSGPAFENDPGEGDPLFAIAKTFDAPAPGGTLEP